MLHATGVFINKSSFIPPYRYIYVIGYLIVLGFYYLISYACLYFVGVWTICIPLRLKYLKHYNLVFITIFLGCIFPNYLIIGISLKKNLIWSFSSHCFRLTIRFFFNGHNYFAFKIRIKQPFDRERERLREEEREEGEKGSRTWRNQSMLSFHWSGLSEIIGNK